MQNFLYDGGSASRPPKQLPDSEFLATRLSRLIKYIVALTF